MCLSSCGLLYEEGKPLIEITCPCGLGYWDIFRERFVSGDQIRKGELSRREYEAKVRANFKEDEFEARLREQWIDHFFNCQTKLALDKKAIREGRGDTSSRRKAEAELKEIARGDFKSRGRSLLIHEETRRQVYADEGERRDRATSQATSREHNAGEIGFLPGVSTPPTLAGVDDRHAAGSNFYTLFDRHRPTESVASEQEKDATIVGMRPQGNIMASNRFFLPGDEIRLDVLEHYRRNNKFGTDATAQPYTSPDGRRGYLIKATTTPTTELISHLRKDSVRVEDAMRQKSEIDQREPIDSRRRGESDRPGPASTRRSFQATRYTVDDIAQETQDLRITSDQDVPISDRGQYDRPQRSVIEPSAALVERRGGHESENPSSEREYSPRELGEVRAYSTGTREDIGIARRGDPRYQRGSADVIVARRDSRPEPREVRYYHRNSLHEPRDIPTAADARRQATPERTRDIRDDSQNRRTSQRDTQQDPRNPDDEELGDSPSQRRYI